MNTAYILNRPDSERSSRAFPISAGVDPSEIKKRSVVINGHRTSISLENVFWSAVRETALARGLSVNQLITEIDASRTGNLSSAIRTHILMCVMNA